jgi:hypothetical protein
VRRAISDGLLTSEEDLLLSGAFSTAVVLTSFFSASGVVLGASLVLGCVCFAVAAVLLTAGEDTAADVVTGAVDTAGVAVEVTLEIIVEGATGPTIFVSLAAIEVRADDVAFSCCGCAMMKEVVFGAAAVVEERDGKTESLSMTGGMLDVRFCRSCSMTSATFRELASFETGIMATSPGGVPGCTGRPFPWGGFTWEKFTQTFLQAIHIGTQFSSRLAQSAPNAVTCKIMNCKIFCTTKRNLAPTSIHVKAHRM